MGHVKTPEQAGDCEEKSLSQLCAALAALQPPLGASLEQQLVRTLRRIKSPDDLFDILINLEALLQDGSAVEDEMPGAPVLPLPSTPPYRRKGRGSRHLLLLLTPFPVATAPIS